MLKNNLENIEKYIVYHHNDHDGIVSAAVFYQWYKVVTESMDDKPSIEFKMIDYTMVLDFSDIDLKNTIVAFLDYSFTNEENINSLNSLINEYFDYTDNIIWIDHHMSSLTSSRFRISNSFMKPFLINGICAAVLTYIFLYSDSDHEEIIQEYWEQSAPYDIIDLNRFVKIPTFLKYIDDYDCWKKIFPNTNKIHYGFNVINPKDPVFDILLDVTNKKSYQLIDEYAAIGTEIINYNEFEDKNFHIDMYGFEVNFHNYKAFVLNRKGNSFMFQSLIDDYDIVIPCYFNGQTKKWAYSIFTTSDNINCEEIAKMYGGGGHAKAAGFQTDRFIFQPRAEREYDMADYITTRIGNKTALYKLEKVIG